MSHSLRVLALTLMANFQMSFVKGCGCSTISWTKEATQNQKKQGDKSAQNILSQK